MRILYTYRSLAVWGGIERILIDKMNYFVTQKDYDVYMLTTCQGNHPVPYALDSHVYLADLGIQFHKQYLYSGFRRLIDAYCRTKLFEKRFKDKLREIHPDIIICTTADPIYSIVKVKGEVPLLVESHSTCIRSFMTNGLYQRFRAFMLRKGLQKVSCVIALTEGDAIEWRKIHSHVEVIPNMVHQHKYGLSSLSAKRVIFVGRFDYQKQPMEAIRIWQKVYPKHPDWHLDIYGEGEQKAELVEVAKKLSMNIHIQDPVNDIFDRYRNSSILISTSLFEPFGLVIPEAMSCGLPVISYDSPYGPSSIITNETDGFLVKVNDVDSFENRLNQLIDDETLRTQMGHAASLSSFRFHVENIMHSWLLLFSSYANSTCQKG